MTRTYKKVCFNICISASLAANKGNEALLSQETAVTTNLLIFIMHVEEKSIICMHYCLKLCHLAKIFSHLCP